MRLNRSIVVALAVVAALILGMTPLSAAPGVIGQWKFNGSLKNSGSSDMKIDVLNVGGTGSFQDVDVAGTMKTAWVFTAPIGLTLSRVPKINRKTFSVDVFLELDSVTSYRRIMSFGPNTADEALYVSDGFATLYDHRTGTTPIDAGDWVHILVTRERTGLMRVYVDGIQQFKYRDGDDDFTLSDGKVIFFKDDGGEHASGTVSLIRFYDHVVVPD